MIKDLLKNSETYYNLSENLKNGLEWLNKSDLLRLEDGRYEINENVYASIQTYNTKDDAKYESHRKYIDIQYIVKGEELVGVTDLSNCKTCISYDEIKDLEFYDINCEEEFIQIKEGQFLILYPHDAHKPSIKKDIKSEVKKVVVKVAI
jgi:YhcH/YjgK/YiaL family protein